MPKYTIKIGDEEKIVTCRDDYPLNEFFDLTETVQGIKTNDLRTHIPLLQRVIVAWDFEGDPSQKESYEPLDAISVILKLSNTVCTDLAERGIAIPKN